MTLFTVVFNAVPPVAGFEVSRRIPFAVFRYGQGRVCDPGIGLGSGRKTYSQTKRNEFDYRALSFWGGRMVHI